MPSKISQFVYNTLFARTSNYVAFLVAGAIGVEYAIDGVVEGYWDTKNKGVCIFFLFCKVFFYISMLVETI